MARLGYARVSSIGQNLDRQKELLNSTGVDKIFEEKESGASLDNRKELKALLNIIRFDDVLVVTELDRLSRKADDLTYIINIINEKQANLEVLNLPSTKTDDPNLNRLINNLIIEIYKYMAESERLRIKERQKQGIALAKKQGKYKGRKKKYTKDSPQLIQAFKLLDEGYSIRKASESTGINYQTLRNYIEEYKK
jgi:DNA invertase Pin-like site-specific DNA recombinase